MKIAIIGAGSWGTALAGMLSEQHEVTMWVRNPQMLEIMCLKHVNPTYLPNVILSSTVAFTGCLAEAVQGAAIIILVTPSHTIRSMARNIKPYVATDTIIVTAAKGLESDTFKRMSEVIEEEMPAAIGKVVALSGPNHAEEVGLKYPSATVVAAQAMPAAETVQEILMTPYFRAYTNSDILGVELAGALKNIIALGAGIADGLGFGDNTKAALMTRGLAEIARLGMAMGANSLTFAGLAGVGDLIATCTSQHSRNRWAGTLIAQGKSIEEIQGGTPMVVEGIKATIAAYHLASNYKIDMPITQAIYEVLYEKREPRESVLGLMNRGRTDEVERPTDWLMEV